MDAEKGLTALLRRQIASTGEEAYGTDPDWPQGQHGGKRPEDLPVPEVPGGERNAMRVVLRGRFGQAAEV